LRDRVASGTIAVVRSLGLVLVLVLVLAGCGEGSPGAYVVAQSVCVAAADTVDLGAGSQAPATDAIPGCRTSPAYQDVREAVQGMCGPCGFWFDRATTLRERERRSDVCCYEVSSPPPPGS